VKPFAKLYETERGQILAMRQAGDEGPEIAFHFYPGVEGLGVCQVKLGFEDNEAGDEKADAAFESLTEEGVKQRVFAQMDEIKSMFGGAA
jgi:hypothetical protein